MTDFGRIISALNDARVKYVLVGGLATIGHGVVRATRDVDAVVSQDPENKRLIQELLSEWNATRADGTPIPDEQFESGRNLNLQTPDGPLDLLADREPPLSYEELATRAETRKVDGVEAPLVSLADLVALKRLANRDQDQIDLKRLEEAHGSLPDPPEANRD